MLIDACRKAPKEIAIPMRQSHLFVFVLEHKVKLGCQQTYRNNSPQITNSDFCAACKDDGKSNNIPIYSRHCRQFL